MFDVCYLIYMMLTLICMVSNLISVLLLGICMGNINRYGTVIIIQTRDSCTEPQWEIKNIDKTNLNSPTWCLALQQQPWFCVCGLVSDASAGYSMVVDRDSLGERCTHIIWHLKDLFRERKDVWWWNCSIYVMLDMNNFVFYVGIFVHFCHTRKKKIDIWTEKNLHQKSKPLVRANKLTNVVDIYFQLRNHNKSKC